MLDLINHSVKPDAIPVMLLLSKTCSISNPTLSTCEPATGQKFSFFLSVSAHYDHVDWQCISGILPVTLHLSNSTHVYRVKLQ